MDYPLVIFFYNNFQSKLSCGLQFSLFEADHIFKFPADRPLVKNTQGET